jgi:hypothetical protein
MVDPVMLIVLKDCAVMRERCHALKNKARVDEGACSSQINVQH